MTAVLFTCAGQRVDIVTAFRAAGAFAVAADASPLAPALYHGDARAIVPRVDDPGYIAALAVLVREHAVQLVVPLSDLDGALLQRGRAELGVTVLAPAPEVVELMSDKYAAAVASEKPSTDTEEEYRRKVRMFEHCWLIVLRGKMLRRLPPLYLVAILSHRHLRYLSGLLHIAALVLNVALVAADPSSIFYGATLAAQGGALGLALLGRLRAPVPLAALAWYYTLVSWATTKALINYLRRGVPPVWEKAAGTR